MAERLIRFGSEGWRARYDDGFADANVVRLAAGVGTVWADSVPTRRVYVGYDTRADAERYARLAAETVASFGLEVILSDRACPMPALNWTIAHDEEAIGGLMISASGAPADYQGITVRDSRGLIPSPDFDELAESLIPAEPIEARGPVETADILGPYIEALKLLVDPAAIADAHLSFVVDPLYGCGTGILADLLRGFGAEVHELHPGPDPDFGGLHPRASQPWVDACEQAVLSRKADAGFVLDGDADRFGLVSPERGFVSPSRCAALVLDYLAAKRGDGGRVVIPVSGSTYIKRVAASHGCSVSTTPVGFRNAYREMERPDTLLGVGEQGGLAFPGHILERDGLAACLVLAELIAVRGQTVAELFAGLEDRSGHFAYGHRDIKLDAGLVQSLRLLLPGLNPESIAGRRPSEVSHKDGLRLGFEDGSWVLLRPSRTKPIVRIYAEGCTAAERDGLLEAACELAKSDLI